MTQASAAAPRIIAVCNQKGGVAKTTTCVNLAAGLAEAGARVLVLDLDAQGNASRSLGIGLASRGAYEVLCGDITTAQAAARSALPGVLVVPASTTLHLAEIEPAISGMTPAMLRARLITPGLAVDVVLIDCPPTLGVLSINAISAADLILVPVTPTAYGIDALDKTCQTIAVLRPLSADSVAVVLTMVEAENPHATEAAEAIRRRHGGLVLPGGIPLDERHAEAASRNRPLLLLHPDTTTAAAYWRLAVSVLRLLKPFARMATAPPAPAPTPSAPPPPTALVSEPPVLSFTPPSSPPIETPPSRRRSSLAVLLTISMDGIVLCGTMDGVILVVEAEATRIPVIEDLRDKMLSHGANVVGVVFNKRRFYIPKHIYQWL